MSTNRTRLAWIGVLAVGALTPSCGPTALPRHVVEYIRGTADEPGQVLPNGYRVVDYDIPVRTDAEYQQAINQWANRSRSPGTISSHLTVDQTATGANNIWPAAFATQLTYCVSTDFGVRHRETLDAVQHAAADWARAANVRFVHVPAEDANCTSTNTNVVFDVRPISGAAFIAAAFFPDWVRADRTLWVDTTNAYEGLGSPWTLVGVMRHELGHALGLRHEHIRSPTADDCMEPANWNAVTAYDPTSVMHYPRCDGTNAGDLSLTALDTQGIQALYGAPPAEV